MNLKLAHVVSDITGLTGMAIIKAILSGERDSVKPAKLRDPRCKNSEATVARALEGHYREELCLRSSDPITPFSRLKTRFKQVFRFTTVRNLSKNRAADNHYGATAVFLFLAWSRGNNEALHQGRGLIALDGFGFRGLGPIADT